MLLQESLSLLLFSEAAAKKDIWSVNSSEISNNLKVYVELFRFTSVFDKTMMISIIDISLSKICN